MKKNSALVSIAEKIIVGNINMLDAIREICKISSSMECRDVYPILMFRGIESDTDEFISINDKNINQYSDAFLKNQYSELDNYFSSINEDIINGAKAIIQKFS